MFDRFRVNRDGFTFIEVMVTLVILSTGIVAIFQSLLVSLDQIDYLTHRLHASNEIENVLFIKEKMLRQYKELSLNLGEEKTLPVGNKTLSVDQKITISEIESYPDIFKIQLRLGWTEGERKIELTRENFIYDANYDYKNINP